MQSNRNRTPSDEELTTRILSFWFGTERPWYHAYAERKALWFGASEDVDQQIGRLFTDDIAAAVAGRHQQLSTTGCAEDALALIILLDQLPRNAYRGTAAAFSGDQTAAAIARRLVEERDDLATLKPAMRIFAVMPLMHAETIEDQHLCVRVLQQLCAELASAGSQAVDMLRAASSELRIAINHRDTIARFGRFPHRNRALARSSTPDEVEFLQTASNYGQ